MTPEPIARSPEKVGTLNVGTDAVEAKHEPEAGTPTAVALLQQVDEFGANLRALLVEAKKLPKVEGLDKYQEPMRSLSIAQENLQTGLMWLRRAIEKPKVF